ncbi:MAG: transcriptional regulator [Candidatus Marinimicrobia bacterium]|nr:transcriptional regulator [Candidatus Neomarinimicrobiota bacterium]
MLDFKALNQLIHAPIRLGIMTVLSQQENSDFNFLKKTLDTSDGNLSTHLTKLEVAGYIKITKSFRDKLPHTSYNLTPEGKRELSTYLSQMRNILQQSVE